MTVAVAAAKKRVVRDDAVYYFCSAHCRKAFEETHVA
jgi:YHS domain-containing protein